MQPAFERPPRMDVRIKGLRLTGPKCDDIDEQIVHLDCVSNARKGTADALNARVCDKDKYFDDSNLSAGAPIRTVRHVDRQRAQRACEGVNEALC